MKRALHGVCAALLLVPSGASAYRPFDQTDAEVAEPREIELELGPVSIVHTPTEKWLGPGFVFNYGLVNRLELVMEGHGAIPLGAATQDSRRWQLEPALLLKGILREGGLQGKEGPSVAAEAGALLPAVPSGGIGGSLAAIASQRWPAVTLHLNLLAERTRDRLLAISGGAILEGPDTWVVRPVGELFMEHAEGPITTVSVLAGAIWRVRDRLMLDAAMRVAHQDGVITVEGRAGVTWTFALEGRVSDVFRSRKPKPGDGGE